MKPLILGKPTIGITGSSGKTTTKELVSSVVSQKYKTFKSPANHNMPGATRRSIQKITDDHEVIVMELAMSKAGRGREQCYIIQPNIGIITSVGHAHFERFDSIKSVAKSKSELIHYMNSNGVLFINNDDKNSKYLDIEVYKGKVVRVGTNESRADYRAKNIRYEEEGMSFQIVIDNNDETFYLPIFGEHNVYNALFAIGVGYELGLKTEEIKNGLRCVDMPSGRLAYQKLNKGITILDDSYNANPESMKASFDVLENLGKGKKKIAVIGDMAELGDYEKKGHEEIGEHIKNKDFDVVITFGEASKYTHEIIINSESGIKKAFHLEDYDEASEALEDHIQEDTIVLVKGSNAMKMNKFVKYLTYLYSNKIDEKTLYRKIIDLEDRNADIRIKLKKSKRKVKTLQEELLNKGKDE